LKTWYSEPDQRFVALSEESLEEFEMN